MSGYWIVKGSVRDKDLYRQYAQQWAPIAEHYGARIIAGAGAHETREGADFDRVLIIEFPSYAEARACYDSAEYAAAMKTAMAAYDPAHPRELTIVEGA